MRGKRGNAEEDAIFGSLNRWEHGDRQGRHAAAQSRKGRHTIAQHFNAGTTGPPQEGVLEGRLNLCRPVRDSVYVGHASPRTGVLGYYLPALWGSGRSIVPPLQGSVFAFVRVPRALP